MNVDCLHFFFFSLVSTTSCCVETFSSVSGGVLTHVVVFMIRDSHLFHAKYLDDTRFRCFYLRPYRKYTTKVK